MAIEFPRDIQDERLIHPVGEDTKFYIVERLLWVWERAPIVLFLLELQAKLSSDLWVINSRRPSRLVVRAQAMTFGGYEYEVVAKFHRVLTLLKTTEKGERRLRVELCCSRWPSIELIDLHQLELHSAVAVDLSWITKGSTTDEVSKVLSSGEYRRFRGLSSQPGPPIPIVRGLHNPLHDKAQGEIDAAFLKARNERRKRS